MADLSRILKKENHVWPLDCIQALFVPMFSCKRPRIRRDKDMSTGMATYNGIAAKGTCLGGDLACPLWDFAGEDLLSGLVLADQIIAQALQAAPDCSVFSAKPVIKQANCTMFANYSQGFARKPICASVG